MMRSIIVLSLALLLVACKHEKEYSGTLVLGLDADPEKKVEIALSQAAVDEEEGGE